MKNRLFKRLSAFVAGTAVALTGALAAMPAASAASNYTLDQVNGTATVEGLSYRGDLVGGTLPSGTPVSGLTMPKYGWGWGNWLRADVSVQLNDVSKLGVGDKITIPLSYPDATKSSIRYKEFACSGDIIPGALGVSCNGSAITLTVKGSLASYNKISGEIPVSFHTSRSPEVTEYVYVQNQFVGVEGSVYQINTEPGGDALSPEEMRDGPVRYDYYTGWGQVTGDSNYMVVKTAGPLNSVLEGTYDSTSPRLHQNQISVTHYEVPFGASVKDLQFRYSYPRMLEDAHLFGDGNYWANLVDIDTVMQAVPLPEDVLTDNPELVVTLLKKPGQYAVITNSDGSIDIAMNWGSLYDNPLLTTPAENVPAEGAGGIVTAEESETYAWLAENGYVNRNAFYTVWFDMERPNVSRVIPWTQTSYWTDSTGIVQSSRGNYVGYYEAGASASGSGEEAQAALSYVANGSGVTGKGPAAVSATVGTSLNIANQGTWARTGYTFTGWNTKADGKGTAYQPGASVTLPREGMALYAQWTAVPDTVPGDQTQPDGYVKVTFAKGANGTLSGQTSYWVNPTKSVTVAAPTVNANTGYTFDKWDKGLTQKFTGNTTITAQYKVEELVEIYRMYDGIEHLYVNTTTERDALVARGWKYEGVAFSTPKTSSTAVHRLFQKATGDHHYTSDPTEIATLTSKHGWTDEGVLFYGDDAKRVELKRLFMAGLGKGEHLHTADPNELNALTTKHGWKEEGISFYVAKYGG